MRDFMTGPDRKYEKKERGPMNYRHRENAHILRDAAQDDLLKRMTSVACQANCVKGRVFRDRVWKYCSKCGGTGRVLKSKV